MACSKRLSILSILSVGLLGPGCSDFSATGETESGSSSSGAPVDSSSASTSTDPSSTSTSTATSTTDAPTSSTTETSSSSSSSTDASTSTSDASSSESGQPCDEGELCAGICVDTQADVANCGGCEDACSNENATPACSEGECVLTCEDGFDNCDTDVATGCEQSLQTPTHCGACDMIGVPEICDGLDNDCAGGLLTDEGCPQGVTLEGGTFDDHDLFGNATGGSEFEDVCPAGDALVGFSGNIGGNVDRIRGLCAAMSVTADAGMTPYTYAVTSGAVTTLPTHGLNATTPFTIECAADTFVVGVTGEASDDGLHDVTIHCAALLLNGAPGSFAITYGPITTQTADGDNLGTAYSDLLSEPAVVDRYRGREGAWIDAIGIGEATVTLGVVE